MSKRIALSSPEVWLSRKAEYCLLIILFRLLMDYMYRHVIATVYAYAGFQYNPSIWLMLLSWLLLFIGTVMTYKAYKNPGNRVSLEVVFLLFLMSFVPFTSMVGSGAVGLKFIVCNSIYWFLFLILCVSLSKNSVLRPKTGKTGIGDLQLQILAVVFALGVLYVSGRYAHFRLNFNLENVYEFRSEASNNRLPLWLSYFFSWSRMVNTILIAYFIRRKKKAWAIGCCFIQLLSFGYDGSKSTFFLLMIAVGVNLLPHFDMITMNKWVLRGLTGLAALLTVHYLVTANFTLISMLIRRVFYLPVQLSEHYVDFFTTHEPDYFRQSFLRYFGAKSPYEQKISYMIGEVYYEKSTMGANNGLIADAVANLGYLGLVVFPVFLSFIFKLLDKSSAGLDSRLFITVGVYLALVMTNSFIFTILLTHGLIVTMIVLRNMKRDMSLLGFNLNIAISMSGSFVKPEQ